MTVMWCDISSLLFSGSLRPAALCPAAEIPFGPAIRGCHDGHGPVALDRHAHGRAEASLDHLRLRAAEDAAERLEEPPAGVRRGRVREVGPAPMPDVAVQRELRYDEHRSRDVEDGAAELAAVVVEDAEREDLRAEALA